MTSLILIFTPPQMNCAHCGVQGDLVHLDRGVTEERQVARDRLGPRASRAPVVSLGRQAHQELQGAQGPQESLVYQDHRALQAHRVPEVNLDLEANQAPQDLPDH